MTITYRTTGTWGAGKGANLTAAEIDGNFYDLDTRLEAVETNPVQPVQISDITSSGSALTVTMDNGDTYGPLVLPVAAFNYRDAWAAATVYAKNDVVLVDGSSYLVAIAHTSDATFDATRLILGNTVYNLLSSGSGGGGGGGGAVDIVQTVSGTPSSGQKILIPFARAMTFLNEGAAACGEAATTDAVYISVTKNSTLIGYIVFDTATNAGFFDCDPETAFAAGDVLILEFPSPANATFADIGINLTLYPA